MLEEQGIDNPLRRKPEVDPHWRLAWRCFSELADARRELADEINRRIERMDFAVDARLPYATGDELGVL